MIFWIIVGIVIFVVNTIILINIGDWIIVGFAKPTFKKEPVQKEYLLRVKNRMDIQKSTECSGYSSAHVLRSFGIEANGKEMYAKMPGKLSNGAVLPRNLKKGLEKLGFKVSFRSGNKETLKAELCKGNRVIAFIRTRLGKKWLHYVSVVGYNEEEVFIADSLKETINCEEEFYNRRLSWEEFMKYWNIREIYLPFYKYTYLVIENTERKEEVLREE